MMKVMQTRPVPEMQATGTKIDKSRMMGDYQVRFCERVRLKCRALLDLIEIIIQFVDAMLFEN